MDYAMELQTMNIEGREIRFEALDVGCSFQKIKNPARAVCNSSIELLRNRWGPAGWHSTSS